jgi:hypothetical protein
MSTEPQTTDDASTDDEPATDDYDWHVEADSMYLAKDGYEYVLGTGSLSVAFDGVRSPDRDYNDGDDGEWELRDDHNTQGYFDPNDPNVPNEIRMAFEVLAHEL